MSFTEYDPKSRNQGASSRNAPPKDLRSIVIITALVLTVAFAFRFQMARPLTNPHLKVAPYIWPSGCRTNKLNRRTGETILLDRNSDRVYGVEDYISRKCADKRYYFPEASKYNFPSSYGVGRNYFRVQNDALNINCFSDGHCVVSNVVRNVFKSG